MTDQPYFKILEFKSSEQIESIALRRKVLRIPLGLDFSQEELDGEASHIHIAAYQNEVLVGVLLFVADTSQLKLKMRQVAVEPSKHGKGIGKAMIGFSEQWAIKNGYNVIELHARATVADFYFKAGYQQQGDLFEEVGIPHIKMYKSLKL